MVRFGIHPIPGGNAIEIYCSAPVLDRREVTSSNGERETRFVIVSRVRIGERDWPIEITLTNRESMSYRMLLGRQAIRDDMMIDPAGSFRQPLLSYRLYRAIARRKPAKAVQRPLRIALVARSPDNAFNRRLVQAAAARGHVLELLELARLEPTFSAGGPGLGLDGAPLAHHDVVVPRIGVGEGAFGAAIVRQLEIMGSLALNPGDAIDRVADRLATVQALARADIAQGIPWGTGENEYVPPASFLRVLVIGDAAIAVMRCRGEQRHDAGLARHRAERRLAERAADVLGLGLSAIDIDDLGERPLVIGVSAKPAFGKFERAIEGRVDGKIIDAIETRVRAEALGLAVD